MRFFAPLTVALAAAVSAQDTTTTVDVPSITSSIGSAVNSLTSEFGSNVDSVTSRIGDGVDTVTSAIASEASNLSSGISSVISGGGSVATSIASEITDAVGQATSVAGDLFGNNDKTDSDSPAAPTGVVGMGALLGAGAAVVMGAL